MSDSSRPHGLQPTRLLHPRDFPGKSTGVGCHCLLRSSRTNIKIVVYSHFLHFFPTHSSLCCIQDSIPTNHLNSSSRGNQGPFIFSSPATWSLSSLQPCCLLFLMYLLPLAVLTLPQLDFLLFCWLFLLFWAIIMNIWAIIWKFTGKWLIVVIVQSLSHARLFATLWPAACQASLSFTITWNCSNSCPLSQWCYPTVSSSVTIIHWRIASISFYFSLQTETKNGKWLSSDLDVSLFLDRAPYLNRLSTQSHFGWGGGDRRVLLSAWGIKNWLIRERRKSLGAAVAQ